MPTNLIKEHQKLEFGHNWIKKLFYISKLPKVEADTAIVLEKADSSDYVEYKSGSDILLRNYKSYYIVDTGSKKVLIKFTSPSKNVIYDFEIEIELKCTAKEPVDIIKNKITNLELYVQKEVFKRVQGNTLDHEPEEVYAVRKSLVDSMKECLTKVEEATNLKIDFENVYVSMDQEYLQYLRDIKRLDMQSEFERKRYYYNRSIHQDFKEQLEKELSNGSTSILIDDYISNHDKGRNFINNSAEVEIELYKKKLELYKKAKDEGVVSNRINEYIDKAFDPTKVDEDFRNPLNSNLEKKVYTNKNTDNKDSDANKKSGINLEKTEINDVEVEKPPKNADSKE